MPIPNSGSIVYEFLKLIVDGERHNTYDVRDKVMSILRVTKEESLQLLPSGGETVVSNRFRNAKLRISQQGLAAFQDSGKFVIITEKGKRLIQTG